MNKSILSSKNNFFPIIALIAILIVFYDGCNQKDKNENISTQPKGIENLSSKTSGVFTQSEEINGLKDVKNIPTQQNELNEQNIYNTQDKRMIIRSGTMSLEVDKYDDSESKIKEITKKYSGYITNSNSTLNANGKKQGTITIRIPSEKFDGLLTELRLVGKEMNENITGKDVTEEYMDADARLKTQQQLEDRLLKLLSEKTAKLTDIVDVEQKLAGVRENIEKTEGRMKYLRDQASYSTLAVSVYEPSLLTTSTGGGFFYEIEQSFKKGLNGFTTVLTGIITAVIALLPVLIIAYLIIYLVMRYYRKRRLTPTLSKGEGA